MDQDGIDILCNAAESDLLFTTIFATTPSDGGRRAGRVATNPPPTLPTLAPTPTSSPSHVCQLCKRVYERADHLQRHLRSHENARNYSCSRCPKRFNRPDLLTRHENTHDRDIDGTGRVIRRTDRAVEACLGCAAAKAKCEDQKPCSRCRAKDLACEMPTKKAQKYRTLSESGSGFSSVDDTITSPPAADVPSDVLFRVSNILDDPNSGMASSHVRITDAFHMEPATVDFSSDMLFVGSMSNVFQDIDFGSWDFNFGDISLPPYDSSPGSRSTSAGAPLRTKHHGSREVGKRHEAFKRSPWLWEPEYPIDYVQRDTEGLQLNEDATFSRSVSDFCRSAAGLTSNLKMAAATRDNLFAIVLAEAKSHGRAPSFPSLELLDYLLQAHFVHDEYHPCYSWIHVGSFDPQETLPELLACVIANGASFISVPAIWQFGLAMQEIVRLRLFVLFEGSNSNTRKLDCIQTYMLSLDIGVWSGFKRRTELSEGFLLPLVTMLRRAGVLLPDRESNVLVPSESDPLDVLEAKWKRFVERESFKRLALHLFLHDVQTSIAFQRPPLLSFAELRFSVPAARDLWRASSPEAWRATYLSKPRYLATASESQTTFRLGELQDHLGTLDSLGNLSDVELCYTTLLYSFHGLITAHRESARICFQRTQVPTRPEKNEMRRQRVEAQKQEIYQDLCEFASRMPTSTNPELSLVAETLKMTLHVSLDELQIFAGKAGEEEAKHVSIQLEDVWVRSADSRYAVWHAGQVFRCARRMPPASLRGFSAMAVYFAGLTLWAFGLLSNSESQGLGADPVVLVDGEETTETSAFLQINRGTPALGAVDYGGGAARNAELLSNAGAVLGIARSVLKENYPVRTEPLPPLVESLVTLLADLGSGSGGRGCFAGAVDG
ncbi:hypothetical protein OQA88_7258 [Cercophora sp. LCS_1]